MKILKSTFWLLTLISLFGFPASRLVGQETGDDPKPAEAAEAGETAEEEVAEDTVESVAAEWQELSIEYSKKMRAASTDDRAAIAAEKPRINDYVERMMVLANNDVASEDGKKALMWIITNGRGVAGDEATDLMIEHHSDAPEMAVVVMGMSRETPTEASLALLDNLAADSPSERVRGVASYARVLQLKQGYTMWTYYGDLLAKSEKMSEEEVEAANRGKNLDEIRTRANRFRDAMPADLQEMYADESTFNTEIEAAFVKVVENFGSIKLTDADDSPTFGDRVESELFELRFLTVGKEAPEIEGEDVDGVTFKLSDYRGKVVVIDFWGDW